MRSNLLVVLGVSILILNPTVPALADGKVVPPRDYVGSLEEKAQEAIIIFQPSDRPGEASEDLILKITVEGSAKNFAWIIPFPNEPDIAKEDEALFTELFDYVESRLQHSRTPVQDAKSEGAARNAAESDNAVEVISRQIVGEFDIAVVRENEAGGLNPWLAENGFQQLTDAEETLAFYRDKEYVFACIRVSSDALATQPTVDSHPLRFTFKTGGRDGIYFPMKMTGLQSEPFDVHLYIFNRSWINDKLSRFGYRHRGFDLRYRDWDSSRCVPNGGKSYSLPEEDPFLEGSATMLPETTKLFQKLHPGNTYYLTNIQARGLKPEDVRQWSNDLWLFPYYTDRNMVPYDARPVGPAHAAYPEVTATSVRGESPHGSRSRISLPRTIALTGILLVLAGMVVAFVLNWLRSRKTSPEI